MVLKVLSPWQFLREISKSILMVCVVALAHYFDDSFMKYNKVYIVDTCTLMHEPGLISWFDGENALLVIPMVVLDELDSKKIIRR